MNVNCEDQNQSHSNIVSSVSACNKAHRRSSVLCEIIAPVRGFSQPKIVNIFLICLQKHMLWYSLEAPHRGASNEYPQHMFSWINKTMFS